MKNLVSKGHFAIYILLCVVFIGCQEKVVVVEQQKVEMTVDTVYTYTYKVERKDNFFDIHRTTDKYCIGDTIKNIY